MLYRRFGKSEIEVSVLALGGHEFLPDGSSRGFNEDYKRAVTPGEIFEGFGGERRKGVLAAAFDLGINLLDVTLDSEKDALGRNLQDTPPPHDVFIQTRPEGMVYGYDEHNARMAEYDLLRAEVERGLGLLRRERLDVLNFGFLKDAVEHDRCYLSKTAENIARLKADGLIRFASADTFSGEAMYLAQIETGCFDSIFINFNIADDGALERVIPAARESGVAVFTREAFLKGALFRMGDEAGVTDRTRLARLAIKWNLSHEGVSAVAVGVDTAKLLRANASVLSDLALNDEDRVLLEELKATNTYTEIHSNKLANFLPDQT